MAKEKKAKKTAKKEKAEKVKPAKKTAKALETFKQPEPKPMFRATCAECGKGFELPFKPTGERPVYCPICFQTKKNTNLRNPQSKPNFSSNRNSDRKMYSATCAKCGQRCEVPFMPAPGKTVFCNSCFSASKPNRFGDNRRDERPFHRDDNKGGNFNSNRPAQDNSQFSTLNSKLDRIISGLNALNAALAAKAAEEKPMKKAKKK